MNYLACYPKPMRGLAFVLLTIQIYLPLVSSKQAPAQTVVSSILNDTNLAVPEYITRHGMELTISLSLIPI